MVKVFRGNSKTFKFTRKDQSGDTIATEPQSIWFSVKRNYGTAAVLFQKTKADMTQLADGSWTFEITPNDTAELDFDTYVCDIKIVDENGKSVTILNPQPFIVDKVVTDIGNEV